MHESDDLGSPPSYASELHLALSRGASTLPLFKRKCLYSADYSQNVWGLKLAYVSDLKYYAHLTGTQKHFDALNRGLAVIQALARG